MKKNNFGYFLDTYFDEIRKCIENLDREKIEKTVNVLLNAYRKEKKVFILGNGGSASTAAHIACDLSKGSTLDFSNNKEKRIKALSLLDNVATITAYGNDLEYNEIFVQQLKNFLEEEDVVIVISASGNSKNLIRAIEYAKKQKAKTIGFLGFKDGGLLARLVDFPIIVDSKFYGPSEDLHIILGHIVATWIWSVKRKKVSLK